MYILKIKIDDKAKNDFRHLNFLPEGSPIQCGTLKELTQALNNVVSMCTRKHRPAPGDIACMAERLSSAERGISIFRPSVSNSYRYPGRALRLELSHIWQSSDCLVAASFYMGTLRKSSYGSGEMFWRGPDTVTDYEVWRNIDMERALSIASEWVVSLERRFPGAVAIFEPDKIVRYDVPLEHYIFDDDGVMVLAGYYPTGGQLYLGTPLGWFSTGFWTMDNLRNIYRLMKAKGIKYPRPKKLRRWTNEIAMQILLTFRLIVGGRKDEACRSTA